MNVCQKCIELKNERVSRMEKMIQKKERWAGTGHRCMHNAWSSIPSTTKGVRDLKYL
jgi:hypothetical protein